MLEAIYISKWLLGNISVGVCAILHSNSHTITSREVNSSIEYFAPQWSCTAPQASGCWTSDLAQQTDKPSTGGTDQDQASKSSSQWRRNYIYLCKLKFEVEDCKEVYNWFSIVLFKRRNLFQNFILLWNSSKWDTRSSKRQINFTTFLFNIIYTTSDNLYSVYKPGQYKGKKKNSHAATP